MRISPGIAKLIIVAFYIIGALGFGLSATSALFTSVTQYALLFTAVILFLYHQFPFNSKQILIYLSIVISAFFIEVIGVNTGLIFGTYNYGSSLGLKLWNTPLMIGINWIMLSYSFTAITHKLKLNNLTKSLIGAGGMVVYDVIMEQIAPVLDMWTWQNNQIPIQNYIAWFVFSFLFISLIHKSKTQSKNPLALTIVLSQSIFFLTIYVLKCT